MEAIEKYKALKEPFDPKAISWRVGATTGDKTSGLALAYIDARDVMGRLDDVLGFENWRDSYLETNRGRTFCTLEIRVNGEWISKTDGAGDSDEEGEKGSISDALKRAAVKFGIGRYLYNLENIWADIVPAGKSFRFKDPASLYKKLPAWAIPSGANLPPAPNPMDAVAKWGRDNSAIIDRAGLREDWDNAADACDLPALRAIVKACKSRAIDTSPVSDNDIP